MKKLVMIMFFSCLILSLAKANHTEDVLLLNVTAESGLKMRSTPGMDGKLLKVIPYGMSVKLIMETDKMERIEWVSGHWVEVEYEGMKGYVFDGFLSKLDIPRQEIEMTIEDMDLIYPLLSWTENRFEPISQPDTIFNGSVTKLIQPMTENVMMKKYDDPHLFKLEVEMEGIRIMDAYQLLNNMFYSDYEKQTYKNRSIFINDHEGNVERIKVNIDNPVEIKMLKNGKVRMTVKSYNEGCGL